jgi:hypothetical protein
MIRLLEYLKLEARVLEAWVFRSGYSNLGYSESFKGGCRQDKRSETGARHCQQSTFVKNEAVASAYLRAAQAYMLISMPTGTSTIFGAFQAILALLR